MRITAPLGAERGREAGASQPGHAATRSPHAALSRVVVLPVAVSSRAMEELGNRAAGADNVISVAEPSHARAVNPRLLASADPDVVLLDACGSRPALVYRAIARLRNAGWDRGILLVIAAEELEMLPVASSVGATDFVLSSASGKEIAARLRRAAAELPESGSVAAGASATGIELHWRTHQVTFGGTTISVRHRELQLLAVLMERTGQIVTAKDLARLAFGKSRMPDGNLTAAYVCSLRKKLAWFGGCFGIQTVRGVGYRFVS